MVGQATEIIYFMEMFLFTGKTLITFSKFPVINLGDGPNVKKGFANPKMSIRA